MFVTSWTIARQAPLFMGLPRQEHWSGLSFPSPGDLPNPEIQPGSSELQADSLPTEPQGKPNTVQEAFNFLRTFCPSPAGHFPSPKNPVNESIQTKGVCVCACVYTSVSVITDSPYV